MYFFLEQAAPLRSVLERRHLPLVVFFLEKYAVLFYPRFILLLFYSLY